MMRRYHTSIGLPESVRLPEGQYLADYTGHAKEAALRDRQGRLMLPPVLTITHDSVFEVVLDDKGEIAKLGFRHSYCPSLDLAVVATFIEGGWIRVITVWSQLSDDKHANLRREEYAIP